MSEINFTFEKRAEMFKKIVEKVAEELELEVSAGYDNDSEILIYDKVEPYIKNSNGIKEPNRLGWDSIVGSKRGNSF